MRDAYITLFPKAGYCITINPCSDLTGPAICASVLEYASKLTCNVLLAIEKLQAPRGTKLCRPHAHLLLGLPYDEGKAVAEHFKAMGLNVKGTFMWDPRRKCWYVGKEARGDFYRTIHPIPQKASPAAGPQRQSGDDGSHEHEEQAKEALSCYEPTEVVLWAIEEPTAPPVPSFQPPAGIGTCNPQPHTVTVVRRAMDWTSVLHAKRSAMPRAP